jgi:phospholipid transport system substrate-binding protein
MRATLALSLAGLLVAAAPAPLRAGPPTEAVKRLVESVRAYKDAAASNHADSLDDIEATLAVGDLARRVLGAQWDKLGREDRRDFVDLLTRLFRKVAYPRSAEFFGDLQVEYGNERVNGDKALVETFVVHPEEGRVGIDYELRRVAGRWVVWDILLDGVSLTTSVRSQMQRVITKESYKGLVKRMREKLEEG